MKLVTLMEDTAWAPEFVCEHGLSFYKIGRAHV